MKITKVRLLTLTIIIMATLFIVSDVFLVYDTDVNYIRSLVFPLFVLLYIIQPTPKNLYFGLFLGAFSLAELSGIFIDVYPNISYYFGMISYNVAYCSLLIYIVKRMRFKRLLKQFTFHLIVLLLFNIYIYMALDDMLNFDEDYVFRTIDYVMESSYNVFIILVLSFSFLSYLYHDTKKEMMLFFACSCIVFSELIQVAYYFMYQKNILNVFYSLLLAIGFFFVYKYISLKESNNMTV